MVLDPEKLFCRVVGGTVNTAIALFLQTDKVLNSLGIESDSGWGVNTTGLTE